MRPVSAAFLTAVAESHTVIARADLLTDGAVAATLSPTAGAVTLDQTAASRGRCDLTLIDEDGTLVPTDPSDALTPYGNELQVYRGVLLPTGEELVSLGVFRIDQVSIEDGDQGVTLQVSGLDRSGRIIDARFEDPYQVAAGTNYATAIAAVLQAGWPEIPLDLTTTSKTTPQIVANEGDDRWKFAQDLAAAIGHALYFDGDGTCVTRPVAGAGGATLTLAEGEGGVLITAGRSWNRQGTFNRVIATGENTGDTPARGVATDENTASPTYYHGPFGRVPRFYASPFITTDAQAADAAAAILARELGTTQQVNFGALVNPALEPGDVVQITRQASGIDETHVVDGLTIPLTTTETMTGRTRATVTT